MEIGIDSFAAAASPENPNGPATNVASMNELLDRIELADQLGLDAFGIGEHHRKDFLDSAPAVILAAAAARTEQIRLSSAVTVLSAADPVRVFQQFATLDLVSQGRIEMVAGRGSFTDAFPLFGHQLSDYDALFAEKLGLMLQLRDQEFVTWSGKFRPPLYQQGVYPRPLQEKLPIWLGVGGTPASFVRAGELGLPLMVAIIGGDTHRFRPLVDLYRQAGEKAGYRPDQLKVGLHSFGYVGKTREEALDTFYPNYARVMNKVGRERGWPPMTRHHFLAQTGELGSIVIGSPEEVAAKIRRHSKALGGISRFSFQMDVGLSHKEHVDSIELIGKRILPLLKKETTYA